MAKNYTWEKVKFKVKEGYYKACDGAKKVTTVRMEDHIYDRRAGCYYNFRKPLTAKQKLEYTTRFSNGENGAEILRDMGVKFW